MDEHMRKLTESLNDLREKEDQMQRLMDALPLLICYVDSDLRYQFHNQPYEHWTSKRR